MNAIKNAAFLDGSADWAGLDSVDDLITGAPGRAVAIATNTIASSGVAVAAGQFVEVSVFLAGAITAVQLVVGASTVAVPLERAQSPLGPYRGIPGRMASYYGRVAAPATGDAFLRVTGTGTRYMLQPLINPAPASHRSLWQVRRHSNPDLDLAVWPTELPWPMGEGAGFDPVAQRKSFTGDAGVPVMRRVSRSAHKKFRAIYGLDTLERDTLEQFYQASEGPFWFTRPDTRQLCRAQWMEDGEPVDQGLYGAARKTGVGLVLAVA